MSFNSCWGFNDGTNEFGKLIQDNRDDDDRIGDLNNEFLIEISFDKDLTRRLEKGHFTVKILSDYEDTSARMVSRYISQSTPNCIACPSNDPNFILVFPCPLDPVNIEDLKENLMSQCGMEVEICAQEACFIDQAVVDEFLAEVIFSHLGSMKWFLVNSAVGSVARCFGKFTKSGQLIEAVSILNIALNADGSGCIRFETACLKIIDMKPRGIESAPSEDEDEMDTTAVLLPTGEDVTVKSLCRGNINQLPYLTALDIRNRQRGYCHYLPDTMDKTILYWRLGYGDIIEQRRMFSREQLDHTRQENGNVMMLIETTNGERFVPAELLVRHATEIPGRTRFHASATAAAFVDCLKAAPFADAVGAPERLVNGLRVQAATALKPLLPVAAAAAVERPTDAVHDESWLRSAADRDWLRSLKRPAQDAPESGNDADIESDRKIGRAAEQHCSSSSNQNSSQVQLLRQAGVGNQDGIETGKVSSLERAMSAGKGMLATRFVTGLSARDSRRRSDGGLVAQQCTADSSVSRRSSFSAANIRSPSTIGSLAQARAADQYLPHGFRATVSAIAGDNLDKHVSARNDVKQGRPALGFRPPKSTIAAVGHHGIADNAVTNGSSASAILLCSKGTAATEIVSRALTTADKLKSAGAVDHPATLASQREIFNTRLSPPSVRAAQVAAASLTRQRKTGNIKSTVLASRTEEQRAPLGSDHLVIDAKAVQKPAARPHDHDKPQSVAMKSVKAPSVPLSRNESGKQTFAQIATTRLSKDVRKECSSKLGDVVAATSAAEGDRSGYDSADSLCLGSSSDSD